MYDKRMTRATVGLFLSILIFFVALMVATQMETDSNKYAVAMSTVGLFFAAVMFWGYSWARNSGNSRIASVGVILATFVAVAGVSFVVYQLLFNVLVG